MYHRTHYFQQDSNSSSENTLSTRIVFKRASASRPGRAHAFVVPHKSARVCGFGLGAVFTHADLRSRRRDVLFQIVWGVRKCFSALTTRQNLSLAWDFLPTLEQSSAKIQPLWMKGVLWPPHPLDTSNSAKEERTFCGLGPPVSGTLSGLENTKEFRNENERGVHSLLAGNSKYLEMIS